MTPIFLFSLPRSGSTLLQRILSAHSDISTSSETWFILPFIGAIKKNMSMSVYSSENSYIAISEFINKLPKKENDYYSALNDFISTIYNKYDNKNKTYFLDKTPRYYYIIPEIEKIFPKAKFIFLFRNPVQIFASIISTWGNNQFGKLYNNYNDMTDGVSKLSSGFRLLEDKSFSINYENLVHDPEKQLKKLSKYLDIRFESKMLSVFYNRAIPGAMGDKNGVKNYNTISQRPIQKWKHIFNTKFRKQVLFKYINSIDDIDISVLGYNKNDLLTEIKELEHSGDYSLTRDVLDIFKTKLILKLHLNLYFSTNKRWSLDKFID